MNPEIAKLIGKHLHNAWIEAISKGLNTMEVTNFVVLNIKFNKPVQKEDSDLIYKSFMGEDQ